MLCRFNSISSVWGLACPKSRKGQFLQCLRLPFIGLPRSKGAQMCNGQLPHLLGGGLYASIHQRRLLWSIVYVHNARLVRFQGGRER